MVGTLMYYAVLIGLRPWLGDDLQVIERLSLHSENNTNRPAVNAVCRNNRFVSSMLTNRENIRDLKVATYKYVIQYSYSLRVTDVSKMFGQISTVRTFIIL